MKILFVCSHETPLPPPPSMIRAGQVISMQLADALFQKGVDVAYLTSKSSLLTAPVIPLKTPSLLEQISQEEYYGIKDPKFRGELAEQVAFELYSELIQTVEENTIDLVHFHTDVPIVQVAVAAKLSVPTLFTIHSNPRNTDIEKRVITPYLTPDQHFMAISASQSKLFGYLPMDRVIHHGLVMKNHIFDENGGDALLFAGRFKKGKGVHTAMQSAIDTHHQIVLTGAPSYNDQAFYTAIVEPMIRGNKDLITLLNLIDRNTISSFYQKGKALLFPIEWEEPFGLVMIEAMAAGTPVIAFAKGSTPEIINDGETGFLINASDTDVRGDFIIKKTGIEGVKEAIEKIYAMNDADYHAMRRASRAHVEKHFTIERMADEYEALYEKILAKGTTNASA